MYVWQRNRSLKFLRSRFIFLWGDIKGVRVVYGYMCYHSATCILCSHVARGLFVRHLCCLLLYCCP